MLSPLKVAVPVSAIVALVEDANVLVKVDVPPAAIVNVFKAAAPVKVPVPETVDAVAAVVPLKVAVDPVSTVMFASLAAAPTLLANATPPEVFATFNIPSPSDEPAIKPVTV